jgi:hypothetical protein
MWLSKAAPFALPAAILALCIRPAIAAEVCPVRAGQPVHFVDVFDGSPEQLATLVPDKARQSSGFWRLGYIYDAGRFVTIRCKYADGAVSDVKLPGKVQQCDYKIDAHKSLTLNCH